MEGTFKGQCNQQSVRTVLEPSTPILLPSYVVLGKLVNPPHLGNRFLRPLNAFKGVL